MDLVRRLRPDGKIGRLDNPILLAKLLVLVIRHNFGIRPFIKKGLIGLLHVLMVSEQHGQSLLSHGHTLDSSLYFLDLPNIIGLPFLESDDLPLRFASLVHQLAQVRIGLLADDYTIVIGLPRCRLIRTELNSIELQCGLQLTNFLSCLHNIRIALLVSPQEFL